MMEEALSSVTLERGRTLAEQTCVQLRDMIVSGAIPANTMLSEYDLARRLAISRSPLREAVQQLKEEGLLESSGSRGLKVPPIDRQFVKNLYEVRHALEVKAASLAPIPLDEKVLAEASEKMRLVRTALDSGDGGPFTAGDFDFHDLYIDRCGNPLLQKQIERIRINIRRVQIFANPLTAHIEASYDEHEQILRALEQGDREQLVLRVGEHINGVSERIMPYIDE